MTRRLAALLTSSALLLAVAACNDSTSIETKTEDVTPEYSQGEQGYLGAHVHVMPLKSQAEEAHARAKPGGGGGGSANTGIYYNGGRVLNPSHPPRVVAIYWAASAIYANQPAPSENGTIGTGSNDHSLIGDFLNSFGPSEYFNINTTYKDGRGNVPNSVTYRGYFADSHLAPSGTTAVSASQIQAEVGRAMVAFPNDSSTIYVVFTAGKVNLGGGFGTQYCAYHGHFTAGGKDVLFAAMPYDYAYPSACTSGKSPANGSLDPGADFEVNTLAHEIEEAATDPDLNAWFDRRGYENADKCAWTWGATYLTSAGGTANIKIGTRDYLVQRNWINSGSGGCYKGLGTSGPYT